MAQNHNADYSEKPMTTYGRTQGPSRRYRRLRHPTFPAAEWTAKNPLLQRGEIGIESDTHKAKVGDGTTYWNTLPYFFVAETEWGYIVGDINDQTDLIELVDDKVAAEADLRSDADDGLQDQITDNKDTMDDHIANTNNPHNVTKAQVGLGNVDNTSDADKPISTATQDALDLKANIADLGTAAYTNSTDYATAAQGAKADTAVQPGDLATVATSGSYNDLLNKPTIGDGVLTIQKNGTTVDTFTANSATNTTVNITVPTTPADIGAQSEITASNKLNADLVDDTNTTHKFVTTTEKTTWNGKQDAISDLATIRSNAQAGKAASDTIATYGDIVTHDVAEFATATQGAKADTALQAGDNVSELVNDAGYLVMGDLTNFVTKNTAQTISGLKTFSADITLSGTTSIKNTTSGVSYTMLYRDASGIHVGTSTQALLLAGSGTRPTFNGNNVAMSADIPTAVSQLTNDTGFITNAVNDLQNYTLTSDLATVATSGSYNDLSDKPTIPTTLAGLTGDVSISSPSGGEHLVYDAVANKWKNTPSSATVSWGGITGSLSNQTDLQNALDAKANVALDNLTSAGKEVCANLAMPSSRYDNLTLGANGSTYTAPADGWFCLSATATNNTSYVTLNVAAIYQSSSGENTDPESILIPAKKGDVATIYYANINLVAFRFVYANGVA